MIRVIIYLIVLAALAYGAVWLAERPGEVAITWQGERIDTSVMVLAAAIAAVVVAAVFIWSILRAILRTPEAIARYRRERRGVRGYLAVSRGLIAVGSGDVRGAKKFTTEALRIAPREPLTLLLSAQSAQLTGDRDTAVATFQELASREDTRVLGLHGLFVEAQRRHDHAAALGFAEEAARHDSTPVWAAQAVLEFRCVAGDWTGALERLGRNLKSKLIDRCTYRRQRAVLLTAQAQTLAATEPARAAALAREAAKLASDLVPAAALAGRLLGEAGERRKAARIIGRAWRVNPHPDLAAAYAALRSGDSARQRLSRVEALAAKGPADAEAALAVARAALDAQEFSVARSALAPYTASPRKRIAALMAELEMAQAAAALSGVVHGGGPPARGRWRMNRPPCAPTCRGSRPPSFRWCTRPTIPAPTAILRPSPRRRRRPPKAGAASARCSSLSAQQSLLRSFPRKRESSFAQVWVPACPGTTVATSCRSGRRR